MKIFISGCAKTRTTLIQWLFTAFNCIVFPGELHMKCFRLCNLLGKDENLVIKRTANSLFANIISEYEMKDQLAMIQMDQIKVVYVHRNKLDTLKSDKNYVPEKRYNMCMEQAKQFSELITVSIDSDELFKTPDEIQKEVADKLGLEIKHKWSTWPDFALKDQMSYVKYPKIFNRLR